MQYTVSESVLTAHLDGEAVLLHMDSKRYFRMNPTASYVWKGLEAGMERNALLASLGTHFEVEPRVAEVELDRLLGELLTLELISTGSATTPVA